MSTKIFPMRTYNPAKNLSPTVLEPVPEAPKIDFMAERAALEAERQARAAQRAAAKAAAPPQALKPMEININTHCHRICDGMFRFFNVDVILLMTLMDRPNNDGSIMRTLRPIKAWILGDIRCMLCDGLLCDEEQRAPAVIFSARPKPPSKKRPVGPACVCNHCLEDSGSGYIETALFAYTFCADATVQLGVTEQEVVESFAKLKLRSIDRRKELKYDVDIPGVYQPSKEFIQHRSLPVTRAKR